VFRHPVTHLISLGLARMGWLPPASYQRGSTISQHSKGSKRSHGAELAKFHRELLHSGSLSSAPPRPSKEGQVAPHASRARPLKLQRAEAFRTCKEESEAVP